MASRRRSGSKSPMKWSVSGQTVRITTPARAAARSSGRRAAKWPSPLARSSMPSNPARRAKSNLRPQVVPGQQLLLAGELHHCDPPPDGTIMRPVASVTADRTRERSRRCPAHWCWTALAGCGWSSSRRRPLQPGEARLRSLLSGISHGTELSLYRGTSAFTDRVFDRGLRAFVDPAGGQRVGVPGDARLRDGERGRRGRAGRHRGPVGDLVHTGTPHQEETVLDVAESLAATYPLVVLPTAERMERGAVHLAWPRSRCRPCTTRRSSSATRSACTGWAPSG